MAHLGIEHSNLLRNIGVIEPPMNYKDVKSDAFYTNIAEQLSPSQPTVAMVLMAVLSHLNTARLMVPLFTRTNEVAEIKAKLISTYHASTSLAKLLSFDAQNSVFSLQSRAMLRELSSLESVKRVRKFASLRNNLVHYKVKPEYVEDLQFQAPLHGLVQAHTGGQSMQYVERTVNHAVDELASGLTELLVPTLKPVHKL